VTDKLEFSVAEGDRAAPTLEKRLTAAVAKLDQRKDKIAELARELKSARAALQALERQVRQYRTITGRLLPLATWLKELPPEHLRLNVGTVTTEANFLAQGSHSSARVQREFRPSNGPILDWGCGSGRTLNWLLADPAWSEVYYGCDVDAEAVAWLKDRGARVEACGDDPPLPYPDNFFAGVFSFSVLTHIPPTKHRAWYEEFRRVLKPGGRVFCTMCGDYTASIDSVRLGHLSPQIAEFGWAFSETEGHYKHVAVVSSDYTRRAFSGILEEKSYGRYNNMDVFMLQKA
jgi:SAM-dependent methyltransferase